MADESAQSGMPPGQPEPPKKPLYRRASTWIVAVVATAATTFATGLVNRALESGVETLGGAPLESVTERLIGCPFTYVIPGRPEATPPPPPVEGSAPEDRDRWARKLGGVDGATTQIRLTLTGTSDQPVVLQGLEIDVLQRAEPIRGFVANAPCGDAFAERYMVVDLEKARPHVTDSVDARYLAPGADSATQQSR